MKKFDLKIEDFGSGSCQKCKKECDDLFSANVSQGDNSKNYILCENCLNSLKSVVDKKNAAMAQMQEEPISPAQSNTSNDTGYQTLYPTEQKTIKAKPRKHKKALAILCSALVLLLIAGVVVIKVVKSESHSNNSYYNEEFHIEGKWKNVGTTTCAQIQSGSVVNFDGNNCNVYSPSDTYAFYNSDGQYHLDCTSGFAGDSMCFIVNIINSDNIELVYGSTTVKLCRVGGTPVDSNNTDKYDNSADESNNNTVESAFVYNKENGPICIDSDGAKITLFQYVIDEDKYYEVSSFDITGYFTMAYGWDDNIRNEQIFNSDLTKIAVYWRTTNDGTHAGWIDNNGNLTDVTNIVHPSTSGFSSVLPDDECALFTSTDSFFFIDKNSNNCYYYDPKIKQITNTIECDSTSEYYWSYFISLDSYDEPLKKGDMWRGKPNNTCYDKGSDYLTTSQGELHLGIKDGYSNYVYYAYITAWGPGFSDISSVYGTYIHEALTPKSQYTITRFAARGNTLLFCGERGSEKVLFKAELNDFKLSEPEILRENTYDLLFWQK